MTPKPGQMAVFDAEMETEAAEGVFTVARTAVLLVEIHPVVVFLASAK